MSKRVHGFLTLEGGAAGALDFLTSADVADGDRAIGIADGKLLAYTFDADSETEHNPPGVIAPVSGTGRWMRAPAIPDGAARKDILTWDDALAAWVVTPYYDLFPRPTASGSVTGNNMKISAANGYAFADFSAADVLTDHVPYRSKLTITDSAGKELVGYLKATGTGETYGDNNIQNASFDTDARSWTAFGCTIASSHPAGGEQSDDYGILTSLGSGVQYGNSPFIRQSIGILSQGSLYAVGGWIKTGDTPNAEVHIYKGSELGVGHAIGATSPIWSEIIGHHTEDDKTTVFIQVISLPVVGASVFIDEVFYRQILTPSETGVTITSTADGETQNWATIDAGFNYNDSAGYTFTLSAEIAP